jgi:hypothetical protein
MKNYLKGTWDIKEEPVNEESSNGVGYNPLSDSPSKALESPSQSPEISPIKLSPIHVHSDSKLRRKLFLELSAFLSAKGESTEKPIAPRRTVTSDIWYFNFSMNFLIIKVPHRRHQKNPLFLYVSFNFQLTLAEKNV